MVYSKSVTVNQLILIDKVNNQLDCRKIDGASASKTGLKIVRNHVSYHNFNPNESLKKQFCNDFKKILFQKCIFETV